MSLNLNDIRSQFPSLAKKINGNQVIYLDGPGGTQVPEIVIDRVSEYYRAANANTHGFFQSSKDTDQMMEEVRDKVAIFLGAEGPQCISFSQNMTSMTYSLSSGLVREMEPGDEILITQLDHEANRGPWLGLREYGIIVNEIKLSKSGHLDYDHFESQLNERTRLVAVGGASNAIGTVNNLKFIREKSAEVGALMFVDAVHLTPHFLIDVKEIGCDFLACSAYKFYGPHVGILYSKPDLLNTIKLDRLKTQDQIAPYVIETGTLNHAAISGVGAAIDFISSFGNGNNLREKIESAYELIIKHEHALAKRLYSGLEKIDGLNIVGIPISDRNRTPTISFTLDGYDPTDVCKYLGEEGVCAWDGHFYAIRAIEILGLLERGGITRVGISLYTTENEIDRTLELLNNLAEA